MNNKTRKWIRAGVEAFIHGGTAAVTSSATASLIDAKDWGLGSRNQLELAAIGFLVNGGMRFMQWWQNNPLPDDETTPPFPGAGAPMISINPLAKVTPQSTFAPPQPDPAGQPPTKP